MWSAVSMPSFAARALCGSAVGASLYSWSSSRCHGMGSATPQSSCTDRSQRFFRTQDAVLRSPVEGIAQRGDRGSSSVAARPQSVRVVQDSDHGCPRRLLRQNRPILRQASATRPVTAVSLAASAGFAENPPRAAPIAASPLEIGRSVALSRKLCEGGHFFSAHPCASPASSALLPVVDARCIRVDPASRAG